MDVLNDDILLRVFDFLNLDDKMRLRRTCRRWMYLIDRQLRRVDSLRLGSFSLGGYQLTSGLQMVCGEHGKLRDERQRTASLDDATLYGGVEQRDLETGCRQVRRFDHLVSALRCLGAAGSLRVLSLGNIELSYRLLMVVAHNLPALEHLELIGCASSRQKAASPSSSGAGNTTTSTTSAAREPSIGSIDDGGRAALAHELSQTLNQHPDEQVNQTRRLERANLVRQCQLVRDARASRLLRNLRHLLVKDCPQLSEFTLSLVVAATSKSLVHLMVESNQQLTGEFLNFCGPKLALLGLKFCPLVQVRFLQDLVKLRQFMDAPEAPPTSRPSLTAARTRTHTRHHHASSTHELTAKPLSSIGLANMSNLPRALYCSL